MSKSSMQSKVRLLKAKFDGELPDDDPWSAENIAKNREKWLRQNKPWVLEGLGCYEYYLKFIKPLQEKEAA